MRLSKFFTGESARTALGALIVAIAVPAAGIGVGRALADADEADVAVAADASPIPSPSEILLPSPAPLPSIAISQADLRAEDESVGEVEPPSVQPVLDPNTHGLPAVLRGKDGELYDFGSFKDVALQTSDLCFQNFTPDAKTQSGHTIKMLGAAFVYMSPSNGRSVLGHVAERFVYCRDQQLFDVLYDYAPMDASQLSGDFEARYGIKPSSLSDDEKRKLFDSLYIELDFDPAKAYATEQFYHNRTIFEAWFDVDGATAYQMLVSNAKRYQIQANHIARHEPLPQYSLFGNNCTDPVKEDLQIINPGYIGKYSPARLTPSFLYDHVKHHNVNQIVVYPSQRLFRILRMKQAGQSTAFEGFVPTSKSLKGTFGNSWVLLYQEGGGPWRHFLLSPLVGSANVVTAAAEIVWGVLTIPTNLLSRIPGLHRLFSKKRGLDRLKQGVHDILASLSEVVWLRVRYPTMTNWTEEEKNFFAQLAQQSALLEFMNAKWEKAPIVIQGSPAMP